MRIRALLVSALFTSCSFNLDVPQNPPGSIVGVLDTAQATTGVSPEGIDVNAVDTRGLRRSARTAANGEFSFAELTPGLYTLDVTPPGFAQLVVANVAVPGGATTDAGVLRPAYLLNTPDEAQLVGLVSAPGGGSVVGATVEFLLQPNDDRVGSVVVGFDGVFQTRLAPGTYHLRAKHPSYVTAERNDVELAKGQRLDLTSMPLVFGLNPATLTGVVTREVEGATAELAPGATVRLSNGQTTTTETDGTFIFNSLPPGTLGISVQQANYVDTQPQRTVTLQGGDLVDAGTLTLSLVRGSIEGTVELSDHAVIDVISVNAVNNGTGRSYSTVVSPVTATPWIGTFSISGLPIGSYTVRAQKPRYSQATTQVSVVAALPATQAGQLILALQQGEFLIDDGDPNNTPGYTRTRQLTLNFTGFPTTGVTGYRVGEDSSLADAGFLPYTGLTQPYTLVSPGDGSKTIFAQYQDVNGTSPVFQNSIVLDTTPPPVPTVSITPTGTPNGSLKFSNANQVLPLVITASDETGLAGMFISEDATLTDAGVLDAQRKAVQATTTFNRPTNAEGTQEVYLQVIDHAGNASPLASDSIIIDITAPQVSAGTVTIPFSAPATEAGFTNSPFVNVNLAVTAQPNGEALYEKLANGAGIDLDAALYAAHRPIVSWIITPGDGAKTVYAVFRDSAGNESAVASGSITLDTVPPSPVTLTPVSALVRSPSVNVNVSSGASDLASTPLWLSGDGNFTGAAIAMPGVSVPVTLPNGSGVYPANVYARFRDKAGNTTTISAPVTVDRDAPTGSFSVRGALADGEASTTLTATPGITVVADSINGASGYLLGTQSLTTCPDPLTSPGSYLAMPPSGLISTTLAAGAQVRACFTDAAGNSFGPVSSSNSITLDTAGPTGCVLALTGKKVDGATAAPAGKTGWLDIGVAVTNCSDPAGGIQAVAINGIATCGNSLTGWAAPGQLSSISLTPPDGTKTVTACVRDAARNVVQLTAGTIQLDTTPPSSASVAVEFNDGTLTLNDSNLLGHRLDKCDGGYPCLALQTIDWADAVGLQVSLRDTGRGATPVTFMLTPAVPALQTVWAVPGDSMTSKQVQLLGVTPHGTAPNGTTVEVITSFIDDVGNSSTPQSSTVVVDVIPPENPVLTGVSPGNRSATLYWQPSPSFGDVVGYVPRADVRRGAQVPKASLSGAVIGLDNRNSYNFTVLAVDGVGNESTPDAGMTATSGWQRSSVPINSPYALRPLDVASRGDDIYLTFSERDAVTMTNGTVVETGNLRMAYSPDRGQTWQLSTIDSTFGWNRKVGRIQVNENGVVVNTVGSSQSLASGVPDRGEVKLYNSLDGVTWNKTVATEPPTLPFWGEVGGGDVVFDNSSSYFAGYYVADAGVQNQLRMFYGYPGDTAGGTIPYFDAPDNVGMSDLRVCYGNYAKVLAWKEAGRIASLSHNYVNDYTFDTSEGSNGVEVQSIPGVGLTTVDAFDLACAANATSNVAYLVMLADAASAPRVTFRGKIGTDPTWRGNLPGSSDGTAADKRYPPRVHAVGNRAFVVYRSTTAGVRLGEIVAQSSTLSFDPTAWKNISTNPLEGHWPVIGGDGVDNVVLAWTDADGASLTVLVPPLPSVQGRGLPGINTASLDWSSPGASEFIVETSESAPTGTGFTPRSTFVVNGTSFPVPLSATTPLYHQLSAHDEFGQGTGEGEIWQIAPFTQGTVIASPTSVGSTGSNTAGVVAHDLGVLVLPPYGLWGSGDTSLTVYRSLDGAQSFTRFSPSPTITTSVRGFDGANGRAVLAYRGPTGGLYLRNFANINDAAMTYPAETTLNATWPSNHVSVAVDRTNNRYAIAASDSANDQIRIWWSSDGLSFTQKGTITIANGATDTIRDVNIWRIDNARLVVTWRQQNSTPTDSLYFAESIDQGATFGANVFITSGTAVGSTTLARGNGNGAYSVLAYTDTTKNLRATITGTDHPTSSSNLVSFVLDADPVTASSFDVLSTNEGHAIVYHSSNLLPPVTDGTLKMAVCTSNCHRSSSWYRRTLATWGTETAMAPVMTQSTISSGTTPRWYVTFRQGSKLNILSGGIVRRLR